MPDLVWQLLGAVLVVLALADIFLTVLYARTKSGLINPRLNRCVWRLFRRTGQFLPRRRDALLSFCGPIILVLGVAVWVLLLVFGFALIYWPAMGNWIRDTEGWTDRDFATAFYVSGYSFTTLGTGDIVPKNGFYRLLIISQAALGFSIFTLTITYLLSVYGALAQRNAFALALHHRSMETGDAAEIVARMGAGGRFEITAHYLSGTANGLLAVLEAHHSYPVIHYFRFRETYYAAARMGLLALEAATFIRTLPDPEKYPHLVRSAAVAELWGGGRHLVGELATSFIHVNTLEAHRAAEPDEPAWRERYLATARRLQNEGVDVVPDLEAGARRYIELRREWDHCLKALSEDMLFDWSEIAPGDARPVAIQPSLRD